MNLPHGAPPTRPHTVELTTGTHREGHWICRECNYEVLVLERPWRHTVMLNEGDEATDKTLRHVTDTGWLPIAQEQ